MPVAAPTDRLKKYYTARIQVQLLRGAIEGYWKAMSLPPGAPEDLFRKSESTRFWPDGGWVGAGRIPVDPWGDPYVIRVSPRSAFASVANYRSKTVKAADVTNEERYALDEFAFPLPGEKEREEIEALIGRLASEDIEERERATQAIQARGASAICIVIRRMRTEKDAEFVARLKSIRSRIITIRATWEIELKPLAAHVSASQGGPEVRSSNEGQSCVTLKKLTAAQADFRANDRDGNRMADFWVRDVAGLYGLKPAFRLEEETAPGKDASSILRLIDPAVANADATEGRWVYPTLGGPDPEPASGYYFAALKSYIERGVLKPYDEGKGRNRDHFGFIAYPAEYGFDGRHTYIIDQDETIWGKDLGGEEIDTLPENLPGEGWSRPG